MTPIAALDIVATSASGEERRVALRLEAPRPTASGTWLCALTLDGLHDQPAPIEGANSLQALCLALRLAEITLRALVADGGRLVFPDGEPFVLDAYFTRPQTAR
jgi:hypothetical protein